MPATLVHLMLFTAALPGCSREGVRASEAGDDGSRVPAPPRPAHVRVLAGWSNAARGSVERAERVVAAMKCAASPDACRRLTSCACARVTDYSPWQERWCSGPLFWLEREVTDALFRLQAIGFAYEAPRRYYRRRLIALEAGERLAIIGANGCARRRCCT